MQMVFPFASLFKQQFGKFVIHKAFIALHTLLPGGPLGAAWMFVDAWEHALVFNEVVFILFPLVRGALGISHYRMYFHLKNAATHGRIAPCSANSIAHLGGTAWGWRWLGTGSTPEVSPRIAGGEEETQSRGDVVQLGQAVL